LARAITQRAEEAGLSIPHPDSFENLRGKGVRVQWDGRSIWVGSPEMLREGGVELSASVGEQLNSKEWRGRTPLLVALDRNLQGLIGISDTLRKEARGTIEKIKMEGVPEVWMLTGDNKQVADQIAEELGVRYEAGLLPEDKVRKVKEWKRKGQVVAMVGDGVNDAPALAAADVGIAMGAAGTDVAVETADIALMTDEIEKIPIVIRLSRKALHVIKENVVFAIAFNALLVILSAQGWMTMILGAVLHQASSLLVIFNSMRLLRKNV
jgi:P-type E1-E2 ATPase